MATRTEKAASRIATGVSRGSKAVADATRNLSDRLDRVADASERLSSPGKVRKAKRALASVAKAAAIGAVVSGVRQATKLAGSKADALEARSKRKSRVKTAAKVAGAAAVLVGAAVLVRKATSK